MTDIVERLRSGAAHQTHVTTGLVNQAADTITALRAEVASKNEQFQQYARKMESDIDALAAQNEKLRAALEKLSCKCPSNCDWEKYGDICPSWVARAALEENTND